MSSYQELKGFEDAIRNLSMTIRAAGALWKDEKYTELSQSVIQVANLSKRVLEAGERSERSASNFDSIAAEKY